MLTERQPRTRIIRAALGATLGVALLALACQDSLAPPADDAVLPSKVALAAADSGGVIAPVRLSGPPLRYPGLLRNAGIEGEVIVEFEVDSTGRVDTASVQVIESSNRGFEKPATDVIRGSTFRPATVNGVKVPLRMRQPVRFRIQSPGDSTTTRPLKDGITVTAHPHPGAAVKSLPGMPPERISGPAARYPPLLRQAGLGGNVLVEFNVNTDGSVDPVSVRVVESTNRAFDQSAVDAIRGSRFRPAAMDGRPVATTTYLSVTFRPETGVENGEVGLVTKTVTPPENERSSTPSPR